ncbi:MAG: DNA repair protein RadC [Patescibacteria group bacterium]|jgi:DNA repair protein RadC|nr:DNA repair protein RadC [Patescibacteria group bacterium]MDD3435384.1 DNA repair protein RadC [Patescibacteria group bacterium]MDD4466734.1 DNA repair protein RadC [Patescibacteria group bacterium]
MGSYNLQDAKKNHPYNLRIRDLASEARPREKMQQQGVNELSSAELLAIILNNGHKKEGVLELSHRVLKEYGSSGLIFQTKPEKIATDLKISLIKACQIVACFELGRRFFQNKPNGTITIRASWQAFNHLKEMGALRKENFRGLYLNSHYQLTHDEVISIGTSTSSLVDPREVFRPALEYGAVAIIVAHNHPSGNLEVTMADKKITKQLKAAGNILGIDLLDHLIIARDKFISLI